MERTSLSISECLSIKRVVTDDRPYAERLSLALALRLLILKQHRGDYHSVLDEIDYLEGLRKAASSKLESKFRHPPLDRFWHKHFSTARHLLRNVGEQSGLARGGNRHLEKLISDIAKSHGNNPGEWPAILAHQIWIGGCENRTAARKLTGDWIIFAKQDGKNYYLDVATHEEGKRSRHPLPEAAGWQSDGIRIPVQ